MISNTSNDGDLEKKISEDENGTGNFPRKSQNQRVLAVTCTLFALFAIAEIIGALVIEYLPVDYCISSSFKLSCNRSVDLCHFLAMALPCASMFLRYKFYDFVKLKP